MDTFLELIQAVASDINVPASGNSLYPLDTIKRAINRSYSRCGALYRWPETEDAQKRDSVVGRTYYDYPTYWLADSMYRLEIDGELYGEKPDGSPMFFNDFLTWKMNNQNSDEKKWSTQWRRFFISIPSTSDGDKNIKAWGQKAVAKLEFDGDTTIFSNHMRQCNDAVVLEAVEILKNKGQDMQSGQLMSQKAEKILSIAYAKIKANQAQYQKDLPMLDVPDFFADNGGTQITGNFR